MAKISGRPDTWMPMYWGDYLRDTNHLDAQEHGAYLMLIAQYWIHGKALPDDDRKFAQICRLSLRGWRTIRPTILAFFTKQGDHWYHQRIETELTKAFDFIEKQRRNGSKGGRPKKPNETQQKPKPFEWVSKSGGFENPNETTSPSQEESSSSDIPFEAAREAQRAEGARLARSPTAKAIQERLAELAAAKRSQ